MKTAFVPDDVFMNDGKHIVVCFPDYDHIIRDLSDYELHCEHCTIRDYETCVACPDHLDD